MRACTYVYDRKYGPFVLLNPHMHFFWWFMSFGDKVPRPGSFDNQ